MGRKGLVCRAGEQGSRSLIHLPPSKPTHHNNNPQITRERFRGYVSQAQKEGNRDRKEFASAIKKLLQFNALMVRACVCIYCV